MSRLDPRAPLVLDMRELGRRPGASRRVTESVPAPAGLGLDVIGVPEGAELELDLMLESVVEGVLVSGTARAQADGECGRCLEALSLPVEERFQELYVFDDDRPGHRPSGASDDDDDVTGRLEGDLLDLEPLVRDAIVLGLPVQPLCRPDCPGLCPECGVRLADHPGHGHQTADPRWAALAGLHAGGDATDDPHTGSPTGATHDQEES